jgi:hypothetical protein
MSEGCTIHSDGMRLSSALNSSMVLGRGASPGAQGSAIRSVFNLARAIVDVES